MVRICAHRFPAESVESTGGDEILSPPGSLTVRSSAGMRTVVLLIIKILLSFGKVIPTYHEVA
jgi:hypothetical protein